MALQTEYKTEDWESYFIKTGISADSAKSYIAIFAREKLMKEPSKDGLGHDKTVGNHSNRRSSVYL